MKFEEHAAKPLLAAQGIAVPRGELAATPGAPHQNQAHSSSGSPTGCKPSVSR